MGTSRSASSITRCDGARTRRIGGARVAGEQESLAAATAEIFGTAIATAAGLGHPRLSAEFLERAGLVPNPCERTLANIVEGELGNHTGCVTGERPARGIDQY